MPGFWSPREELSEGIDEEAATLGTCFYKDDIAENYFNCAPQDQQLSSTFSGEIMISLQNLTQEISGHNTITVKLTLDEPELWSKEKEDERQWTPVCDTILINTDEQQISLIWRVGIERDRDDDIPAWLYVIDPTIEDE
ncbi:hypothetical protein MNBD_GAMMA12-618 [hydrothermal vent metagenome]|uniref:DUF2169 domain-containing protein n=1 Tax=hydrothermal vent metagenome TaxID=652676 RepID=A0A3B0Z834_9ZZZZ